MSRTRRRRTRGTSATDPACSTLPVPRSEPEAPAATSGVNAAAAASTSASGCRQPKFVCASLARSRAPATRRPSAGRHRPAQSRCRASLRAVRLPRTAARGSGHDRPRRRNAIDREQPAQPRRAGPGELEQTRRAQPRASTASSQTGGMRRPARVQQQQVERVQPSWLQFGTRLPDAEHEQRRVVPNARGPRHQQCGRDGKHDDRPPHAYPRPPQPGDASSATQQREQQHVQQRIECRRNGKHKRQPAMPGGRQPLDVRPAALPNVAARACGTAAATTTGRTTTRPTAGRRMPPRFRACPQRSIRSRPAAARRSPRATRAAGSSRPRRGRDVGREAGDRHRAEQAAPSPRIAHCRATPSRSSRGSPSRAARRSYCRNPWRASSRCRCATGRARRSVPGNSVPPCNGPNNRCRSATSETTKSPSTRSSPGWLTTAAQSPRSSVESSSSRRPMLARRSRTDSRSLRSRVPRAANSGAISRDRIRRVALRARRARNNASGRPKTVTARP